MNFQINKSLLSLGILSSILAGSIAFAEEESSDAGGGVLEEQVVLGRFLGSSQQLLLERQEDEAIVDVLDAESISRMGDSTVAAALRRVPGLTLINNKFIYVRGLGERYSQSTLNGAYIPSPDLSRNVIPLDLFPASIVSSLSVQKTYTADMSANFAGGSVDIRTNPFPDKGFNFSAELGSGMNNALSGDVLTYNGGGDDRWGTDDGTRGMPSLVMSRLEQFQGQMSPTAIAQQLMKTEGRQIGYFKDIGITNAAASEINRQLAASLNRDVAIREADESSPDFSGKFSIGNTFDLSDSVMLGFQFSGGYDSQWRERTTKTFEQIDPTEFFGTREESTFSVGMTGTSTIGARLFDEHDLSVSNLFLRNTDDEVSIYDYFDENTGLSTGIGNRIYGIRYEQRELNVVQFRGSHVLGFNTRDVLSSLPGDIGSLVSFLPEESKIEWFWSESLAETKMPNQVTGAYLTGTNLTTGAVETSAMSRDTSAVDFRFTDLEDDVVSYGWNGSIPFEVNGSILSVRFGYQHDQKMRAYEQREFGVGSSALSAVGILGGSISEVLSDSNITNANYGFQFGVQGQATRSYLAALMTDANYAIVDWDFSDSITVSVGARDEYYRQVALPWDIYGYTADNPQLPYNYVTSDTASENAAKLANAVFEDSGFFPAASMVYKSDWLAETFQLRLGYSSTAIRPDLREVMDASYQDPFTGEIVYGNENVTPAESSNFDVRADWFFDNGNSFTVSGFYKDISDPIEFFEVGASDTNRAREIINAESTTVTGLEVEGLYELGGFGAWGETLFVKGNATLQDSETVAGVLADNPTNNERPAQGASDYVVNVMLGYDSESGEHTASLMFNVFGERLYTAGRNGTQDVYEQPFSSMDIAYAWYPSENFTVKIKLQNILDEAIELKRGTVMVFEEKPGMGFSASAKYDF